MADRLQPMAYLPVNPDHTTACEPEDHRLERIDRFTSYCRHCDHRVNNIGIAIPDSDCPEECEDRYSEDLD